MSEASGLLVYLYFLRLPESAGRHTKNSRAMLRTGVGMTFESGTGAARWFSTDRGAFASRSPVKSALDGS